MTSYYHRYCITLSAAFLALFISCKEEEPAPFFCNSCGNDSGTDESDPCNDGVKRGYETDIDCGGRECEPCAVGDRCLVNDDCVTKTCIGNLCEEPACDDFIKNSSETDVDCGSICRPCIDGSACQSDSDCLGGTCQGSICSGANSVEVEFPSAASELDGLHVHSNGGWFIAGGTYYEEAFTLDGLSSVAGMKLSFDIRDETDISGQGKSLMIWLVTVNDKEVAKLPYRVGDKAGVVSLNYSLTFEEIASDEDKTFRVRLEQEEDYCEDHDVCGSYQFVIPGKLVFYGKQ
ncbi:MAG: hypothetical protein JXA30_14120 [Deltaproteobacteria bacterium]|nr:hypothetical protein [Deltaproteobacteria bacterium]